MTTSAVADAGCVVIGGAALRALSVLLDVNDDAEEQVEEMGLPDAQGFTDLREAVADALRDDAATLGAMTTVLGDPEGYHVTVSPGSRAAHGSVVVEAALSDETSVSLLVDGAALAEAVRAARRPLVEG